MGSGAWFEDDYRCFDRSPGGVSVEFGIDLGATLESVENSIRAPEQVLEPCWRTRELRGRNGSAENEGVAFKGNTGP